MSEQVQINNIFLNPTDYKSTPKEIGNTKRTPSGDMYTQTTAKYMTFKLSMEGLSPSMHSNLLYLVSLNRGFDEETPEDLTFIDLEGEEYTVSIPVEGYDYNLEKGVEDTYSWDLTLEEV